MDKMTITEALSEINLIKKKAEKKTNAILANLTKPKHLPDQLESEGGSKQFLKQEIQALEDLYNRQIKIKGSIGKANITNNITINGKTQSIHDWLIWKRDIAQVQINFNTKVYTEVKKQIEQFQRQPQIYKDKDDKTQLLEIEPNVEYGEFLKKTEELQDVFDKLDGQLSLKNATIIIEI